MLNNSLSSRVEGKPEITLMDGSATAVTPDGFKECAKAKLNLWCSNTSWLFTFVTNIQVEPPDSDATAEGTSDPLLTNGSWLGQMKTSSEGHDFVDNSTTIVEFGMSKTSAETLNLGSQCAKSSAGDMWHKVNGCEAEQSITASCVLKKSHPRIISYLH